MKIKVLAFLMAVSFGYTGDAFAARDYTMIVSPARYSVLQVMFDVIEKRSSVLVSYQIDDEGQPFLHVWNNGFWTEIEQHDLGELNFVQKTPSRVVMIGDSELLPQQVKDALSWLPEVVHIRQLENAALLNEFGRVMAWNEREWAWFSARYNLELEDEASAIRKSSWYDQTGPIIKQDQPSYQPVPVVNDSDTLNPSSTTLPSPDAVTRPSDLPASSVEESVEEEAEEVIDEAEEIIKDTSSETEDEIQEIVDALESASQATDEMP